MHKHLINQNKEKEIEFFNTLAEKNNYDVLGDFAYKRLLTFFTFLVKPRKGEHLLDLGCGTGAFTKRLQAYGLHLSGMDISPRSIARACEQTKEIRYLVGDIQNTELNDECMDIIVYSGVLHHFDTDKSRIKTLQEGFRILRPSGRLFAFDPSAHSPSMWLYRNPKSPLYSENGKTPNEVLLTRKELFEELACVGFQDINIRGVGGITFRYVASRFARQILFLYNFYEHIVRLSPCENWLGTFLISAARKP